MSSHKNRTSAGILLLGFRGAESAVLGALISLAAIQREYLIHQMPGVAAACEAIANHRYQIIFFNYDAAANEGLPGLGRIRRLAPEVALVVYCSRKRAHELCTKTAENGKALVQDFVYKGHLQPDVLERVLEYAFERQKLEKALEEAQLEITALQAETKHLRKQLKHQSGEVKSTGEGSAGRVLVVDDEPLVREIMEVYLEQDNYEVVTACNGKQAFEIYSKSNFDVVLTDRAMPEMDGIQLASEIKKVRPEQVIILLSGVGGGGEEKPPGFNVMIAKPFTLGTLRAALAEATGVSPAQRLS